MDLPFGRTTLPVQVSLKKNIFEVNNSQTILILPNHTGLFEEDAVRVGADLLLAKTGDSRILIPMKRLRLEEEVRISTTCNGRRGRREVV